MYSQKIHLISWSLVIDQAMVISTFIPIGKKMFGIYYEMNCCTQYFIWEKYAYFCDILIKIKLYAQNVQPKNPFDVVIREGDNCNWINLSKFHFELYREVEVKLWETYNWCHVSVVSSLQIALTVGTIYLCILDIQIHSMFYLFNVVTGIGGVCPFSKLLTWSCYLVLSANVLSS